MGRWVFSGKKSGEIAGEIAGEWSGEREERYRRERERGRGEKESMLTRGVYIYRNRRVLEDREVSGTDRHNRV